MNTNVMKNTGAYVLASFIPMAVNFLVLLPVYTRFLTPTDYGILALLNVLSAVLLCLSGFQIASALGRFYFDYDTEGQSRLFSTYLIAIILINLGILTPIHLYGETVTQALFEFHDITYIPMVRIILIIFFLTGLNTCGIFMLRTEERGFTLLSLAVIQNLCGVGFGLYFVAVKDLHVYGALLGTACALAVYAALLLWANRTRLRPVFDLRMALSGLRFSLPLIPQSLGSILFIYSDKYILSLFTGNAAIGLYDIGDRFASLYRVGGTSFKEAYSPVFTCKAIEDESAAVSSFKLVITQWTALLGFLYLALALFSQELIQLLLTEPFQAAYAYVPILLGAYFFHGMSTFPLHAVRFAKATSLLPMGTFLAGFFNIAANLALIPRYGVMAAAWTTLISFLIQLLFLLWMSHRTYRLEYEWSKITSLILVTAGLFFLVHHLPDFGLLFRIITKGLALAAYAAWVLWWNPAGIRDEAYQLFNTAAARLQARKEI